MAEVARPLTPAGADPVESLGVLAGVVVDLQPVVAGHLELVRDRPDRHGVDRRLGGLEALARGLEAVVAEREPPRAELLRLLPGGDPVLAVQALLRAGDPDRRRAE